MIFNMIIILITIITMITMNVMILLIRRLSVWKMRNWIWPRERGNLQSSLKKIGVLQSSYMIYIWYHTIMIIIIILNRPSRWMCLGLWRCLYHIISCHHVIIISWGGRSRMTTLSLQVFNYTVILSSYCHHTICIMMNISRIKHMAMIKAKREEVTHLCLVLWMFFFHFWSLRVYYFLKPGGLPPVWVWELLSQNHTFRGTEGSKTQNFEIYNSKYAFHILILYFLLWECTINSIVQDFVFLSLRMYFLLWECIYYFCTVNSIMEGLVFLMESCVHFSRERSNFIWSPIYGLSLPQCIYNEHWWTLMNIDEHWWTLMNIDNFSMKCSNEFCDTGFLR